jgi:hypothetical protein
MLDRTAEPDADGSITVYFSRTQPEGVKRGNWIQTMPGKGWFIILQLYSPLEPFFKKEWRPSEVDRFDKEARLAAAPPSLRNAAAPRAVAEARRRARKTP